MRVPHTCIPGNQDSSCPQPLVKLPYTLSTLATSPLSPWLFTVAGEMAHAYLFDRRMTGRIEDRWGVPLTVDGNENGIHCVRMFGRASRGSGERNGEAHVTGARMAKSNGHELLLCMYHSVSVPFVTSSVASLQRIMPMRCTDTRSMTTLLMQHLLCVNPNRLFFRRIPNVGELGRLLGHNLPRTHNGP